MNMTGNRNNYDRQLEIHNLKLLGFHLSIANLHSRLKVSNHLLASFIPYLHEKVNQWLLRYYLLKNILKLDWLGAFLTMLNQKFTNQLLCFLNLYLHGKNQVYSSLLA